MKRSIEPSQKQHIIKAISSYLLCQREDIFVAYLFGSFVTGKSFSDIDLGVLTRRELANPLSFEFDLENELEKVAKYQLDVRVLNSAPISFCQSVIRNAQIILDRDANLRSDFEGKILKQYFDFSRFRRRYLEEVINAPV